jgi:nucleoside-diphosphate-sugar epimerase
VRDLVYVDDVVNGILNAETHPINGEVFILSGEGISHRAFNELVLALRGLQPRIKLSIPLFLAAFFSRQMDRIQGHKHRYGYTDALGMLTQEWQFNSSKAAQVLSYKPRPLEVGFKSMLNWLRT